MTLNNSLYSSKTIEWPTPQWLFDKLNGEFLFTLDVCANEHNKKVSNYFDIKTDGLKQKWSGSCWMNPPYGKTIKDWVKKAAEERKNGVLTVALIPARVDTKWFHEYVLGHAEIRFLNKRLEFGDANNKAPFPCILAIYRPGYVDTKYSTYDLKKRK